MSGEVNNNVFIAYSIPSFYRHKMRKKGIKGEFFAHSESMEEKGLNGATDTVVLSMAEAEEYRAFKKQKRMEEVRSMLSRSETEGAKRGVSVTELKRICDATLRVRAAAVRVYPNYLASAVNFLKGGAKADCVVGGNGETTTKVKAYECKQARKLGASEITLVLSSAAFKSGRTGEIKREVKKVVAAARKRVVKVAAEGEWTRGELLKLAKLLSASGAKFLSVPYFDGVETLKKELGDCCMLEVTGVIDSTDYKTLAKAGVERIGTTAGEEIFALLMKEAEESETTGGF